MLLYIFSKLHIFLLSVICQKSSFSSIVCPIANSCNHRLHCSLSCALIHDFNFSYFIFVLFSIWIHTHICITLNPYLYLNGFLFRLIFIFVLLSICISTRLCHCNISIFLRQLFAPIAAKKEQIQGYGFP